MNELIELALDAAQRAGAAYADVRVAERETESQTVKNGALEAASSNLSTGFGVRVLVDGAWGFSGSAVMTRAEVERVTREAIDVARASGLAAGEPVVLDDTPPQVDRYHTRVEEDPFAVSIDDKLALLFEADAAMARVPGVTVREGTVDAARERKTFASSEGANIEQELTEAGAGIEATAVNEHESQVRSWPNSAGGQHVTGGVFGGGGGGDSSP